jgi:hypothetical protein
LVIRYYIVDRIGDLDVIDHSHMRSFLENDELAASDQADVAFAVADDEVCDDLVSWQVVDVVHRSHKGASVVLFGRNLDVFLAVYSDFTRKEICSGVSKSELGVFHT